MIEFKVSKRRNWSARFVACRVAQCIGVGDPLAWNDGDKGFPLWEGEGNDVSSQSTDRWNISGRWTISSGNDHWLRVVREEEDRFIYSLNYRYTTPHRQEALEALGKWLECDLNFGE